MNTISCRISRVRRSRLRSLAIAFGCFLSLAGINQANTTRVLTAADGRTMTARIISKNADQVEVIRAGDSQRFNIPLVSLSEADREFLATWQPQAPEWKPSSVSLRPCNFTQPPQRYRAPQVRRSSYAARPKAGYTVTRINRCTGRVISRQTVVTGGGGCRR